MADPGARFENLVAMHLLKFCHFLEDTEGHAVELFYLRDRAGHEVDFLVTHNRRPWFAVEAKLTETRIDPNFAFFRSRLGLRQCYQVVQNGTRAFGSEQTNGVVSHRRPCPRGAAVQDQALAGL